MSGSFWDYLTEKGIHPWLSDIVADCLVHRRPLDDTLLKRLADAFYEYMHGDLNCASLAGVVRAQGYSARELQNMLFSAAMPAGEATVYVTGENEVPYKNARTIALGTWNISERDGVEYYPYFAAGMFTCLDPARQHDIRQQRIEYHWPDFSLPGR
ncbi:MAG: hypothetical protein WCQ63_03020 [Methanomethylophilus sp.]